MLAGYILRESNRKLVFVRVDTALIVVLQWYKAGRRVSVLLMLRKNECDPTAALSPGTRWHQNSPRRRLTSVGFVNLTLAGKTEWLTSSLRK